MKPQATVASTRHGADLAPEVIAELPPSDQLRAVGTTLRNAGVAMARAGRRGRDGVVSEVGFSQKEVTRDRRVAAAPAAHEVPLSSLVTVA